MLRCRWGHSIWACQCGRIALDPDQDTPPQDQPSPDSPLPDPVAQLDQERAERLRLEGENRQLRDQLTAKPREPAKPEPAGLTAEEVEKALQGGEITQAQAMRLLARIESRQAAQEHEAERTQQDALARATTKISRYVSQNPELKDRNSPLMRRVAQELRLVEADYGMNPEDPRAQALAIERVVGPRPGGDTVQDEREYERLRRSGGLGGFDAGEAGGRRPHEPQPKSKGERIFTLLLPEFQTFYIQLRGSKELAIKTLEHADEANLRKAGRFAA